MIKDFPGERWKEVRFDFDFINDYRLEVSNFGRLRSFNKISEGDLVKGSMINGYRIIRLKFFVERDTITKVKLNDLQQKVIKLSAALRSKITNKESKKEIEETSRLLESLKKNLKKKFKEDTKKRTINYHSLIHRLVAIYFLPVRKAGQTVVAHLDFNKLNNKSNNLRWMTPEENFAHQQKSPYVIREKEDRKNINRNNKAAKLTVTKVMLLKKLLNQKKPVRLLVKQFKITDMQVYRIKRGENWTAVPAAE